MERFIKLLVLTMLVSMMAVGSAFAGVIAVPTSYTTAAEGMPVTSAADIKLDGTATPMGNVGLGSIITYTPGIALNIGDKITFTLTNAIFKDTNYYLLAWEGQAAVGDIDADANVTELQEVGNWISGGSGTSAVTVRIARFNVGATWTLYLVSSNADSNTNTAKVAPTAAYANNIKIRLNAGLTNGQLVTLSAINAEDVGGTPLNGANTTVAATIIDVENQWAITFTRGTSEIDVTSPSLRTKFVEEGAAGDILTTAFDTDLAASAGTLIVNNDSNSSVEDFVNLATYPAALTLTLGNAGNVYTALNFVATAAGVYLDGDGVATVDGTNYYFNSGTHVATIPAATYSALGPAAHGSIFTDDVYLGVTGTTLLTTQVFPLTALIDFTNASINDVTVTDTSFITWTINGYQGIIPYMTTDPLYATYCMVSNTSTAAADVVVDVLSSETATVGTNKSVGSLAGLTTARLNFVGNTITNALTGTFVGVGLGAAERYSARLTVTADQNQVYVNCIQADPAGSKRMVPVLVDGTAIKFQQ